MFFTIISCKIVCKKMLNQLIPKCFNSTIYAHIKPVSLYNNCYTNNSNYLYG